VYGDQDACVASARHESDLPREISTRTTPANPPDQPVQPASLTVSQLSLLGASNNSTPVFQQHSAHTLRAELDAQALLIIDYTDAFGTSVVRAVSGADQAAVGSEIWLPDWLTPVNADAPVELVDIDPMRFAAVPAFASGDKYTSALAVTVPGTTGASGMIVALVDRRIAFDDSQLETVKTIAGLISLSASRSKALDRVQRDEAQVVAAHTITRTVDRSEMLEKFASILARFFEFDVIVHRARNDDKYVTQGMLVGGQGQSYAISDPEFEPVESRAATLRVAVSNSTIDAESSSFSNRYSTWNSEGIASFLVIPLNGSATQILVLGSVRAEAFNAEAVATANRLVPTLTAALVNDNLATFPADGSERVRPDIPGYLGSIASATDLMTACGVVATQITNRFGSSRVQVGFIDEETGRPKVKFDTETSEDILDLNWVTPDEIELLTLIENEDSAESGGNADRVARYSRVRVPLKVAGRAIGFVDATQDEPGFEEVDVAEIKRISAACAPILSNIGQLEHSRNTLEKLEMLNRVCDHIRLGESGDPLRSTRVASLIRNLFDADWLYFGSIDHTQDQATTEITDGLDVPQLAAGVHVSRRSLLISSTKAATGPVSVELDSMAPGQHASGRWMFRAGLRSAVCAPLTLNGVVVAMFMCASREPTAFGPQEIKMAARIVTELESSIEKAATVAGSRNEDPAQIVLERLGPNLQAILDNTSVIVLTIDSKGIVTDVAGRGFKDLALVPERLLGRDFILYSRKIRGLGPALKSVLGGQPTRVELEVLGIVLDAWMEPTTSEQGTIDAVTVVVSDITDRVRASNAESALQSLAEEKELTSKFAMWIVHEMKSPLTTAATLSQTLGKNTRGNLHPDQLDRLGVVEQNGDRLISLVDDFLKISKMKSASFEIKPKEFLISELARDIEDSFIPVARGRDQKLSITVPDDSQVAVADRELLRQAIVNLLTKASKYSPVNTTISFDIWIDSYDLRITVTDEGPGIPEEDRDRVFEPYRQLENLGIPGTGMGLAIVRQIVELHHGKVWIEDSVGGGTSLAIWLPDSVVKP
jgi:signal transduction histidine kinase